MTRSAALTAALLALAACDAEAPDDEVVGVWTLSSATTQDLATVSTTQSVLDGNLPPDGAAVLSGDQAGRLPYLYYVARLEGGLEFGLSSADPAAPTAPETQQYVTVTDWAPGGGGRVTNLQVTTYGPTEVGYYTVPEGETAPFSRSGWTVQFGDAPLVRSDGTGREVRVGGSVTLGTRTLQAGVPSALSEFTWAADGSFRVAYVLEADGTFRLRTTEGNRTIERTGTWTRDGGRLSLTVPYDDGVTTETQTYALSVTGTTLTLTDDSASSPCDALCRSGYEEAWGMTRGSLQSYRTRTTLSFAAASPSASARTGGVPPRPMPTPLRARLLFRTVGA